MQVLVNISSKTFLRFDLDACNVKGTYQNNYLSLRVNFKKIVISD